LPPMRFMYLERLRSAAADLRDRPSRRGLERRLAAATHMALTDELTGLPNRRALDAELDRELERARRHDSPLCVAIVDLDHFKEVNDERGHAAADVLLKEVASRWRGTLRITDFLARSALIARYGGEEFVVLLPDCDEHEAFAVADRLRVAMPAPHTCSVGIARWDAFEAPSELIARADRALYHAKHTGRDRTVYSADHAQHPMEAP
jgi:diguanylate cyclase (GGDEF)-like protein